MTDRAGARSHTTFLDAVSAGDGSALRQELLTELAVHRARQADNPLTNPIAQMAFDISRRLEAGEITFAALSAVAKGLSDSALIRRAERLRGYVGLDGGVDDGALRTFIRAAALGAGEGVRPFADFARLWQRPALGMVFTAHPTFGLSRGLTGAVVAMAGGTAEEAAAGRAALAALPHQAEPGIDLAQEHAAAQAALVHARRALDALVTAVLEEARALYGDDWRHLDVVPATLASWVGYDLDGRTDIRWSDSFRFRLAERAARVRELEDMALALPSGPGVDAIIVRMGEARAAAEHALSAFATDLSDVDALVQAANAVTGGPHAVSVAEIVNAVDGAVAEAQDDYAVLALLRLKAQVRMTGLGTAHIHLRVNATQLHNGIRKIVEIDPSARFAGRLLAAKLDDLINAAQVESVNFGTLDLEPTTAIRQFVLMAQILKHVDAETPIRFLIAECDSPLTVLSALYFARRFGVLDRIDISPLFETPAALEKGGAVMEQLLESDAYCDYVRQRGRICIQTGFSDAGRFVGALPATLAIERLHMKLADLVERLDLGVEVVIFDTHGESMGRGAHPESLDDRFDYLLSPAVRDRFAEAGIPLKHEVSFQGGDGYLLFGNDALARATVAGAFRNWLSPRPREEDRLYAETDFALDFFLRLKTWQEDLFQNDDYGISLGAFGPHILFKTGSRRTRRQHDAGAGDGRSVLAGLRAIPHNALLQQLGYVANVVSGLDFGVGDEHERFVEMVRGSDRLDRLMRMVAAAKQRSSLNAVGAYAGLYDAGFWTSRAYGGGEPELIHVFRRLATVLRRDRRHEQMMRLVHQLRHDAIRLHDILDDLDLDGGKVPDGPRLECDLLHAIRVALLQRMFILAARVPAFTPRNDVSPDEILRSLLALDVPEALTVLRATFPCGRPGEPLTLTEPATYDPGGADDYHDLHETLIEPLDALYQDVRRIGVGIAHHFGAYG